MKSIKTLLITTFFMLLLSSCATTALYGNEFEKVSSDVYTLKIYWGGPPPAFQDLQEILDTVDKRLDKEAKIFISSSNIYTAYEVIEREQHGGSFVYEVKFLK